MPNLEKESDSNSLAGDRTGLLSVDDAAKLVGQRLDSLRRAGLTHLPKGTGQYEFEASEQVETGEQTEPRSTAETKPVSKTSGVAQPAPARTTGTQPETWPAQVQESPAVVSPASPVANSPAAADVPAAQSSPSSPATVASTPATDAARPAIDAASQYGPSLPLADRVSALQVLQEEVARCTRCDELASTRSQTVFGVGNPGTRLVLLGEGPGADEDRLGEPFVGAAGQLLDKIISACSLSRSDVYILNAVKCRPPGNRNPSQDELANCWGYAERQLEILQPGFICCLGSVAARTLLKTTLSIGKLRRQLHTYRGSRVLVTYHPAYLLRTPSAKKHVWEDMQLLMKEMGIELSK